jgi:hypothetical protein
MSNNDNLNQTDSSKDTIRISQDVNVNSNSVYEINGSSEFVGHGYALINIDRIYHEGGKIVIYHNDSFDITIENRLFKFMSRSYDIKEELSSDLIQCEAFAPEYGIFVVEVASEVENGYNVIIDEFHYFIEKKYDQYIKLYSQEEYVLNGYPVLSRNTPLRVAPSDTSSLVIDDYDEYSYLSIKVEGDWLFVNDDKDCPLRDAGDNVIAGWVRWRKNGELLIQVALLC